MSNHPSKRAMLTMAAVALAVSAAVQAAPADKERVIVQFKPGSKGQVEQAIGRMGGEKHLDLHNDNAMAVSVPAAALTGLRNKPQCAFS